MKHTPGPWIVDESGQAVYVDGNNDTTRHYICKMYDDLGRTDNQLNARLIAAAPDLLAALKALFYDLKFLVSELPGGIDLEHFNNAENALAKAEGREDKNITSSD